MMKVWLHAILAIVKQRIEPLLKGSRQKIRAL
jgi:hypothetical protein